MIQDIKTNKIKSGFIVLGFVLIISLIVYYICMAFDLSAPAALCFALVFSIASAWLSYYNSDKIILSVSHARPATEEEDKKIINILEGLMVSSGLKAKPRLYVVQDSQPNAFATGRNPEHAIICVTTGLLEKLEYYELEGVIAHEMAHIKNYDILLSAIVTVMVGFIVMLSDIFTRSFFFRSGRSRSKNDNNSGSAILMLIGLIFLILSPIIGKIMQMAVSRRREYLADSTAVQFTRNPDGLISALKKLDNDPNELKSANKATENMYIVNPLKSTEKKKVNLFSTHPSIEDRIKALENIK